MVASFRGSGVGEEPRDIRTIRIVLCAVLLLSFPQLSSRRSRAGSAYRDDAATSSTSFALSTLARRARPFITNYRDVVRVIMGARAAPAPVTTSLCLAARTVRRAGVKYCEVSKYTVYEERGASARPRAGRGTHGGRPPAPWPVGLPVAPGQRQRHTTGGPRDHRAPSAPPAPAA